MMQIRPRDDLPRGWMAPVGAGHHPTGALKQVCARAREVERATSGGRVRSPAAAISQVLEE